MTTVTIPTEDTVRVLSRKEIEVLQQACRDRVFKMHENIRALQAVADRGGNAFVTKAAAELSVEMFEQNLVDAENLLRVLEGRESEGEGGHAL